jgi:peptide/nickel transport system permease protein
MMMIILRRLGIGAVTLIAVSIIIFAGTKVLPGDAAQIRLGQEATPENVAAMRAALGLDKPIHVQYLTWFANFATGDLGQSLASDLPVTRLLADRYKNTLYVGVLTALIAVPISIVLGIIAAMYPRSLYDKVVTFASVALVSAPEFFVATLMVLFFSFYLDLAPAVVIGGIEGKSLLETIWHFFLPILVLCFVVSAQMIRMTRAAVLNVMSSPYIEMAILKGVPRARIIIRHALFNAIGPIVNVVALNLAYLVSGVVIVEVFFAYPGMATLMVQGVQQRDFALVQGIGMIFCAAYIVLMLAADIASIVSNPRLRHPK